MVIRNSTIAIQSFVHINTFACLQIFNTDTIFGKLKHLKIQGISLVKLIK